MIRPGHARFDAEEVARIVPERRVINVWGRQRYKQSLSRCPAHRQQRRRLRTKATSLSSTEADAGSSSGLNKRERQDRRRQRPLSASFGFRNAARLAFRALDRRLVLIRPRCIRTFLGAQYVTM